MTITANLPDGRVLNFPDGTDPSVIQSTVKNMLGVQVDPALGINQSATDPNVDFVPTSENLATQQPTQEERSFGDYATGAVDALATIGTGATTGAAGFALGSLEGIAKTLTGNATPQEGLELATKYADILTNTPDTEVGKDIVKFIGDKLGVLPPVLGTPVAGLVNPQRLVAGVKLSPETVGNTISNIKQTFGDSLLPIGLAETASKKGNLTNMRMPKDNGLKLKLIAEQTLADNPNIAAVTKMVNDSGEIVTRKNSKVALKNLTKDLGRDRATEVVSVFENMRGGSKKDLNDMLNIVQGGRDKPLSVYDKRPSDILGRAFAQRGLDVEKINKKAGRQVGHIAENELSKSNFDITGAASNFFESMGKLGVKAVKGEDGTIKMDFSNSKFIGGNESLINRLANFVGSDKMNGLDAHTTKQFARELVDFGSGTDSAIAAGSQAPIKNLARDLNSILVNANDNYGKANKKFSDSVDIKSRFDKLTGAVDIGGDLADQSLANKAKRLASNADTRAPIKQLLTDAEAFLSDNTINYKNDINSLLFATKTLEDAFKIVPENSFQGGIQRGITNVATGLPVEAAIGKGLMDKVFNLDKSDFNKKMQTFRLLTTTQDKK